MKLSTVRFEFTERGATYTVTFAAESISVDTGNESLAKYDNSSKQWKPCATHAQQLVKLAVGRQPGSNQGKRRARATKPKLGLVSQTEGWLNVIREIGESRRTPQAE